MRVLIACEFSGRVRDAFTRAGHTAWSCDLEPTELVGHHIQADVLTVLNDGWDLMIAHPPCTYLSRAGANLWRFREREQEEAFTFVRRLAECQIPRIAIENPVGLLSQMWRYPDQMIHPWAFGDPYTKPTCLWLKRVAPLMATHICTPLPAIAYGKGRTKGAFVYNGSCGARWRRKRTLSRTFPGIAQAMAEQWGAS